MAKRGGRRAKNKPAKGGVKKAGEDDDPRHKRAIVRSLTTTMVAMAADAGVTRRDIVKRATEHLHSKYPKAVKVTQRTVEAHLEKLEQRGDVGDLPRPGRPVCMTALQLSQAVHHFEGGFWVTPTDHSGTPQWYGFTSIVHAMLEECPNSYKLRELLKNSNLSLKAFWEAMCHFKGPNGFKKITIRYEKKLPDDVLEERVQMCKEMAHWTEEEWDATVYMDEKAIWLTGAGGYECYASEDMDDIIREGQLDIRESYRIKFVSAVNAKLGGVYIEQISGSHGLETPWLVRT